MTLLRTTEAARAARPTHRPLTRPASLSGGQREREHEASGLDRQQIAKAPAHLHPHRTNHVANVLAKLGAQKVESTVLLPESTWRSSPTTR